MKQLNKDLRTQIASKLGAGSTISKVCEEYDISIRTAFNIQRAYKEQGLSGLRDRSRAPLTLPSKISPSVQNKIISTALDNAQYGPVRFKQILTADGVNVSVNTISRYLMKAKLATLIDRTDYFNRIYYEGRVETLNASQIDGFKALSPEFAASRLLCDKTDAQVVILDFNFKSQRKKALKAQVYAFVDLYSLNVEVVIDDRMWWTNKSGQIFDLYKGSIHPFVPMKFLELHLWYEFLHNGSPQFSTTIFHQSTCEYNKLLKSVFLSQAGGDSVAFQELNGRDLIRTTFLNPLAQRLQETLSECGQIKIESKRDKFNLLEQLIESINEIVLIHNASYRSDFLRREPPHVLETGRGSNPKPQPVIKLSTLMDEWLDHQRNR